MKTKSENSLTTILASNIQRLIADFLVLKNLLQAKNQV